MAQFDLSITLEYDLVSAIHPIVLIQQVRKRIADNWQPLGGVFSYENEVYQTMVREKPKEPTFGTEAPCKMCGQLIRYVGPYWEHLGELQPRHPAWPKD